jgi:hypothetical protein
MQKTEVPPVGEPAEDSPPPNEQLWRDLELVDGDDSAVRALLAAGIPIYYEEDDTPEGLLIKEYPDGHRELVRFRRGGDEVIGKL